MTSHIQKLIDDVKEISKQHDLLYKQLYDALESKTALLMENERLNYDKEVSNVLEKAFEFGFKIASVDKHGQAYVIASNKTELLRWGK